MAATASRKAQIRAEREKLDQQILQVDDQIRRCHVISPVTGTLLAKYRERGELAVPGQPLFKVANLDSLILRAFITGSQLSEVAPGQPVDVRFDTPEGLVGIRGRVTWISEASEFTPKIIQTREERVNLVYAIKVITPNDGGRLKIGMPGEVRF
jgi:HlyD family secretion protein